MNTDKAIVSTIVSAPLTIEPDASKVASVLNIDENGNVTFTAEYSKSGFGLRGLVVFAAEKVQGAASASIIGANTLRLARSFPDIQEGDKKRKAFDVACEQVRALVKSESAFQNVAGLIPCLDIRDSNSLPCSPFAVKESLGVLRKLELVDEKGTLKPGAGKNAIVKALKDKTGVNAMRPIIQKVKDANPTLFPKGGRAKVETQDVSAIVKGNAANVAPENVVPEEKLTAELVVGMLKSAFGMREKLMAVSTTPSEDKRKIEAALIHYGWKFVGIPAETTGTKVEDKKK